MDVQFSTNIRCCKSSITIKTLDYCNDIKKQITAKPADVSFKQIFHLLEEKNSPCKCNFTAIINDNIFGVLNKMFF